MEKRRDKAARRLERKRAPKEPPEADGAPAEEFPGDLPAPSEAPSEFSLS
jgi:hypothetical protein